jgi:hypothetical protein
LAAVVLAKKPMEKAINQELEMSKSGPQPQCFSSALSPFLHQVLMEQSHRNATTAATISSRNSVTECCSKS